MAQQDTQARPQTRTERLVGHLLEHVEASKHACKALREHLEELTGNPNAAARSLEQTFVEHELHVEAMYRRVQATEDERRGTTS